MNCGKQKNLWMDLTISTRLHRQCFSKRLNRNRSFFYEILTSTVCIRQIAAGGCWKTSEFSWIMVTVTTIVKNDKWLVEASLEESFQSMMVILLWIFTILTDRFVDWEDSAAILNRASWVHSELIAIFQILRSECALVQITPPNLQDKVSFHMWIHYIVHLIS